MWRRALALSAAIVLGVGRPATAGRLKAADVERIIAQGVVEARRVGLPVTIAVVDREGNQLGVFEMDGAENATLLCGRRTCRSTTSGPGFEGFPIPAEIPVLSMTGSDIAAISKAGTAAFFSTQGNAFSTRSASFIVQQHFPPGVTNTSSGPLFGVQFSQLPCSDVNAALPLGLSGDPGGLPLYKHGRAAGGVGVEGDGIYRADLNPTDDDVTREEQIAVAATVGFPTPDEIRGDRIYVNGLRLPFRNVEPGPRRRAPTIDLTSAGTFRVGPFDSPASRIMRRTLGGVHGGFLVNEVGAERFPIVDAIDPPPGDGGLTAADVRRILGQGARQADRTRAGIRRPIGDRARVNLTVVDRAGTIIGFFRTADAPVFGIDVSAQKARTAAFFSSANAAARFRAEGMARAVRMILPKDNISGFVTAAARDGIDLDGRIAFSDRAVGFLSRPFFPDGIDADAPGPFSRPIQTFSIFNDGLQVELVKEVIVDLLINGKLPTEGCTRVPGLPNGIQIFPGSVPLYRGRKLIGAIGISGDGVDQDDIVAAAGSAGFEAPPDMRADQVMVRGIRLPYVKFPRRPTDR
ncbi:MAG TPA: heme-binding protein [Candidatus Binatia bacterium]|nr:heme-binding protein [Candidatus Binatia bacterium]